MLTPLGSRRCFTLPSEVETTVNPGEVVATTYLHRCTHHASPPLLGDEAEHEGLVGDGDAGGGLPAPLGEAELGDGVGGPGLGRWPPWRPPGRQTACCRRSPGSRRCGRWRCAPAPSPRSPPSSRGGRGVRSRAPGAAPPRSPGAAWQEGGEHHLRMNIGRSMWLWEASSLHSRLNTFHVVGL